LQAGIQPTDESFDDESPLYASRDWSARDVLLEELLKALYAGQQIKTGNETER
jgi:hypothetical protein